MRVVFVYPPPWKISAAGRSPSAEDGPPAGFRDSDIDGDFYQLPYGLLTLASFIRQAGHRAKIVNLSGFDWDSAEGALREIEADVYGISNFTANRRGVALVARAIKQYHPNAHVVVGGPHATALPREVLTFIPHVDSVVVGEGELTLLELLDRIRQNASFDGVEGLAHRTGSGITVERRRGRIRDLDTVPSPHRHYKTHLLMTSRGCPGDCTFCAKSTTWGTVYRAHSEKYVLDELEMALQKLPVKMIMVKDDTFTVDKKRVLAICRSIEKRGLNFLWSCDSRADAVDAELLLSMRRAGCMRISIGVESGSPAILRAIRKKVSLEQVLLATTLAKKIGIQVRYYMMLGNRGETASTFRDSVEFVRRADPHQVIFACLSVYPGTSDFETMRDNAWITPDVFYSDDFQELKTPFDASESDTRLMSNWFEANRGVRTLHIPTVLECKEALALSGELHAAHMDLAAAHYRAGQMSDASEHVQKALELDYPAPGLAYNYLACISAARGDYDAMSIWFDRAKSDRLYPVLARNLLAVEEWNKKGRQALRPPLLSARHEFEFLEMPEQPSLPGPLPPDFDTWETSKSQS